VTLTPAQLARLCQELGVRIADEVPAGLTFTLLISNADPHHPTAAAVGIGPPTTHHYRSLIIYARGQLGAGPEPSQAAEPS
jgi:hypothetical protein